MVNNTLNFIKKAGENINEPKKGGKINMAILKFLSSRKFYWGAVAAALGMILYPKAKENIKPSLEKSLKEMQDAVNKVVKFIDENKQKLSEAIKNKMEELNQNISKDGINKQKEEALNQLEYLKAKIQALEEEIKSLG